MNPLALTRSYRPLIFGAFCFGVLTVAMNLGLQTTASYLIAKAAQHPESILLLWVPIVAVRFFGTARAAFRYLDRYFAHDAALRWLRDLKTAVYQAIEPKSSQELKAYGKGDLMARVGGDVDRLQNLLVGLYEPLFISGLGLVLVLVVGLMITAPIAWALVLMLTACGALLAWTSHRLARFASRTLVDLSGRMSSVLVQILYGMTDIWAMNLTERAQQDVFTLQDRMLQAKRRLARLSGLFAGLTTFVSWAGMWVILQIAIVDVNAHHLRAILLPVAALLTLASFELVGALPGAFQEVGGLQRSIGRIADLAAAPSSDLTPKRATPAADVPAIEFQGVSLSGSNRPDILRDVSFTLSPGRHIALIGPNGSGKSTLVHLAAALIPCTDGTILMDGTDLKHWDPDALRRELGVVNQFPHVFRTTLRQNLIMARPSASPEELNRVFAASGMEPLVQKLPDGLDTILGERGASLSGGELKRLAIARVLLKDAPIWLLDEPTEGLDPLSARRIMSALMQSAQGRTVLWITHATANLDLAEEIMILNQGRLVAKGPRSSMLDHAIVNDLTRFAPLPG